MASCLQLLCDKRRKNGGFSNNNYQESGDNAHCLMEEFCCLYSEKLKAIDEEYQDSLEPKCQALTELVSDLTEQNYLLLKAVEELEKEALSRVEAFGSLAEAAKDTIQQDNLRRGIDANESHRLESKVQKLQDALKQNESHMLKCTMEIDQLNKCLLKKHSEVNNSQACLDKMYELESTIGSLESNLKEKCDIIKCLQEENDKLKGNAANGDLRLEEVKFELDQLKEELNQKNCVLNKIQNGVYNPLEETRLDSMKNSNKIFELNNHIKWLEDKLNEQEAILKHTISERDALQFESNQQNTDCDDSNRIETLFQRIECLQEEIEDKNCSIVNLKDQEEKYMYEMSRMKTFMKSMERQFTEKIMCLESEIDKKDALLLKYTKQLENMNSFNVYDEKNAKDNLTRKGANSVIIESKDHSDFNRLKFKLKEIQEALTGEIADKHDEIRRLKDDVKELEEKLLHADKQTQFKDDIIKELRKEVKVGRAKTRMENGKTYERPVNISIKICSTKKSKVKDRETPYPPMIGPSSVEESPRNASNFAISIVKKKQKPDINVALPLPENNLPNWAKRNISSKTYN